MRLNLSSVAIFSISVPGSVTATKHSPGSGRFY
jgi:hypothetical protein